MHMINSTQSRHNPADFQIFEYDHHKTPQDMTTEHSYIDTDHDISSQDKLVNEHQDKVQNTNINYAQCIFRYLAIHEGAFFRNQIVSRWGFLLRMAPMLQQESSRH